MKQQGTCLDKESLVAYLYDEPDEVERRQVEHHLAGCASCAREVRELRAVRSTLRDWEPAGEAPGFRLVQDGPAPETRREWWRLPAWAQAIAAVLVLSAGAAIANLDVRYGSDGLVVRTGWQREQPARPVPFQASASMTGAPWRTDLSALERRLREEFVAPATLRTAPVSAASSLSDEQLLARVRQIVQESEQRQRRELGMRIAEVLRDVDVQRRADLVRMENGLGALENRTGLEVAQQRQMLMRLVSQVR
jgi:anti-sigma factor RsiW